MIAEAFLIFLDIDGVLCPQTNHRAKRHRISARPRTFDAICLAAFETALERFPQINVVISSNWRKHEALEKIQARFSPAFRHRVVGVTPIIGSVTRHYRYNEVLLYLKHHDLGAHNWIAVEDDDRHYPASANVVLTDTQTGFDAAASSRLRDMIVERT